MKHARLPCFALLLGAALLGCAALFGCGRPLPPTQFYNLVAPEAGDPAWGEPPEEPEAVIVVEELFSDAAYGDERMVYRTTPFQLGHYEYHRWISAPHRHLSEYLQRALGSSGHFAHVERETVGAATAVLGGRIGAFEEVLQEDGSRLARVDIELRLEDIGTRELLWSQRYVEEEPLRQETPEGLAHALSLAMGRIVATAAPPIAQAAAAVDPGLPPGLIFDDVGVDPLGD